MKNKEKNFASAVIYVHNASSRIEKFLQKIIQIMEENFEHSEIICVNDASEDNSLQIIRETSQNAMETSLSVVTLSYFHGVELAMKAGVDMSIGDFVFEFDNTIDNFESDVVMNIYKHSLEGYDIVSASPDMKAKFTSRIFYKIFDDFSNLSYKMGTESFRILSRRVINRVGAMNKTVLYRKAVYANCGLKTDNIKYQVKNEKKIVEDKHEKKYRSELAMNSLILFTDIGYRFSISMTILMMIISLLMAVYSLVTYLLSHPVAGWTTTILFLAIAFFGLFGVLTTVVKYLQLIIMMIFKRKQYSFESIEKLTK